MTFDDWCARMGHSKRLFTCSELWSECWALAQAQAQPVMDAEAWAELHRLRETVKGPNGFATWQEAATSERIKRADLVADLRLAAETLRKYELLHRAKAMFCHPEVEANEAAAALRKAEANAALAARFEATLAKVAK